VSYVIDKNNIKLKYTLYLRSIIVDLTVSRCIRMCYEFVNTEVTFLIVFESEKSIPTYASTLIMMYIHYTKMCYCSKIISMNTVDDHILQKMNVFRPTRAYMAIATTWWTGTDANVIRADGWAHSVKRVIFVLTHGCVHARTHSLTRTLTHMRAHDYAYTNTHAHTHKYTRTRLRARKHTLTRTHTSTHIHIYTLQINVYTHVYTYK
jgi:hypothetical protein